MRKIQLVKFEEVEIAGNRMEIEILTKNEFSDEKTFKTERYFVNHYLDEKNHRIDFAMTKKQEEIFRSFIIDKYNFRNILEQLEITESGYRRQMKSNIDLNQELNSYKKMKFWNRFKFLFSGSLINGK